VWQLVAAEILELSGISDYDYVCLIATYTDLATGDTHKVSNELAGRGYSPEVLAKANKVFETRFAPVTTCGLKFTKPFVKYRFEPFGYLLTLFDNYERGNLPFPGSISEQPAQIMEMFSVLKQLKHEHEMKAHKQSQSKRR
jgi:hypothetical protein